MILNTINRYALAVELLSLRARINIISEATGLSMKILRKAYFDMHGKSPPSGSLKFNPNFIYKSISKSKEATIFVFFFRIENHDEFSRRCISAYNRYEAYVLKLSKIQPLLDVSDCWMLAKWSICGVIKLSRCGKCRSAKLIINDFQKNHCPICRN